MTPDSITEYYFSLPITEFCRRTGIGQTLCRAMIADGRLRAVRAGKKKLLVDVGSWRELMQRQAEHGTTEYTKTEKAREVRAARRKEKPKADLEGLNLL